MVVRSLSSLQPPDGEGWVRVRAGNYLDEWSKFQDGWNIFGGVEIEPDQRIEDFRITTVDGPYAPADDAPFYRIYKLDVSVKPVSLENSIWREGNGVITPEGWIDYQALMVGEWFPYSDSCDSWIKIIKGLGESK